MQIRDFDNVPMMLLKTQFDYYIKAHCGNEGWMLEQTLNRRFYESVHGYHVYILAKRENIPTLKRHGWKEADIASCEEILKRHPKRDRVKKTPVLEGQQELFR